MATQTKKPAKAKKAGVETQKTEKRGRGRPSDYSPEIAAEICSLISDGMSVREIGRAEEMPDARTIFRWLAAHDDFCQQYALACEARSHFLAEDLLDIADDGTNDWMERRDEKGEVIGWRENGEAMQRSKLRVDTRKWLLSKLMPKKYGDALALTGKDGGPIAHTVREMTDDELLAVATGSRS